MVKLSFNRVSALASEMIVIGRPDGENWIGSGLWLPQVMCISVFSTHTAFSLAGWAFRRFSLILGTRSALHFCSDECRRAFIGPAALLLHTNACVI